MDTSDPPRCLGRYELLRPLAEGGMAEVYLARRRAAGVEKQLVVKRMRPEAVRNPRLLDLFVREARLSMTLVHQNIVPVFDFGRIGDQVFLAMEHVDGKDLGLSLARARGHRVPPLVAAFIAAECCQALDYAHHRKGPDGVPLGIVHRDVTPRNVLLSWSGEVKLTDFGIAALAGDTTARLLGTPEYMAPEQAHRQPLDPRADVYAIGLVLREAVTGSRARPGASRHAILGAARRGELLPWSHLAAVAPALGDPSAPPFGSADDRVQPPAVDVAPVHVADGSGVIAGGSGSGSGDLTDGALDLSARTHDPASSASPRSRLGEPPPADLVAIIDRATAASPVDRYPDAAAMLDDLDRFIVAYRAAHRAASPARQLAAWLVDVWGDDTAAPSASAPVDAISLVDVSERDLGDGTVRSLAATADDAAVLVDAIDLGEAATLAMPLSDRG